VTPEERRQEFEWLANATAHGVRFGRRLLIAQGVGALITAISFGFVFTDGGWLGWVIVAVIGLVIVGAVRSR
jgi:hypothetical protein